MSVRATDRCHRKSSIYPKELLEIQLLDDAAADTDGGFRFKKSSKDFPEINFKYVHRVDRTGFKAGALREGENYKVASG